MRVQGKSIRVRSRRKKSAENVPSRISMLAREFRSKPAYTTGVFTISVPSESINLPSNNSRSHPGTWVGSETGRNYTGAGIRRSS